MTVQQYSSKSLSPNGCPVSGLAAGFDPFRGPYQVDPSSSLREARAEEPVFYSPELDYWVVTRYEDVKRVFKNPDEFSATIALEPITPISDEAMEILGQYAYVPDNSLVNEDDQSVHRRLLAEPFGADSVATLEPRIRAVVNSYLDRVVRMGKADLVDDLLYEVPCIIALIFLGAPDEDIEKVRSLSVSQALFTWGRPDGEEQSRVADTFGRYWQFTGELLDKVKADPNATGWMAHIFDMQRQHPDLFSDNYVQNLVMGGIFAAHETTTNATGNAFRTLLENRVAWDEICANPDLIPKAVEECLRYSGSVVAWRRRAIVDTTVGGVKIPAGGKLLLVTSSANRDDDIFPDPDEFDIHRGNARRHLTFGIGVHTCLGATLARLEMKVILGEVARRLPHMRLVEGQEFRYLPNTSFRGPEHLLIEWDPTANPVPADRP
ncbi:cytochrome P450 [Mycolicibacterium stellerae]|uniref:cytochrome P450 n=1 Tax=Mycolicibacterium stellerae TaxID=2358193 RepID=UPI000F0B7B8C|nr:cytochrome P450 [Mycolicibacterium stellerae]